MKMLPTEDRESRYEDLLTETPFCSLPEKLFIETRVVGGDERLHLLYVAGAPLLTHNTRTVFPSDTLCGRKSRSASYGNLKQSCPECRAVASSFLEAK
jgi:hypothetical protein